MVLPRVARLVLAVFASLAVYALGVFIIFPFFSSLNGGGPMTEWTRASRRAFWAVMASYPLVTLVVSMFSARKLRAPVVATVVVTASGIAIPWLLLWIYSV